MSEPSTENKHDIADLLARLANEDFCYLTTIGRVTGKPHQIEIWFVMQNNSVYLMSGSHRSDWVKNLLKDSNVTVRIAKHHFKGRARLVNSEQEEMMVRNGLADKYKEREEDGSLSEWARTALPVAIDLKEAE